MIQLATDPEASRTHWRPQPAEAKVAKVAAPGRHRSGHAWPFISRNADHHPAPQQGSKRSTSGS